MLSSVLSEFVLFVKAVGKFTNVTVNVIISKAVCSVYNIMKPE